MPLIDQIRPELEAACASTLVSGKLFWPDRFDRPFSSLHISVGSLFDSDYKQVAAAAPRGIGKTTIAKTYILNCILFRKKKFILFVSTSATSAETQLDDIRMYLESNPFIKEVFGDLKSARWSKSMFIVEWEDGFKTMILPRGAGQQVRGQLFGGYRPDLIVVDDLEDDEEIMNEEQRKKLRTWFHASLKNCVDRGHDDWKIIYIDTIKHEDALLQHLLEDPSWKSIRLELCDDNFNSYWEDFMSTEAVKALRDEFANNGELDAFYREYRSMPIAPESSGFRASDFIYYEEEKVKHNGPDWESIVIVDPAKTANPKNAQTAILGSSINMKEELIDFRDLVADFFHPDEAMDEAFSMCERLHARYLGIEVTGLEEFITYPYENEIKRRNLNIELIKLKPRGAKKELRARALIPFYRRHQIRHNKSCMGPLEAQLLSFPRPRRWDCIDTAAYVIEMLDEGERFMFGSDDINYSMEDVEKEFSELDDLDMIDIDVDWVPNVSFEVTV